MELALNEAKIQSKILLKSYKNSEPESMARLAKWHKALNSSEQELQLKHCQMVMAKELGFQDWQHLKMVLAASSSNDKDKLDMGTLFYAATGSGFINQWFTTYEQAKTVMDKEHYLLPYKMQFVVVGVDYIKMLGLTNDKSLSLVNRDLFASYPSKEWDGLALQVLRNR